MRQHQIENQQIGRPVGHRLQRVAPRRQHLGGKPRFLQVAVDQFGDVAVVFDDENAGHDRPAPAATPAMVRTGASANAAQAARASKRMFGSRLAEIDIEIVAPPKGSGVIVRRAPSQQDSKSPIAAARANHRRTAARAGRPSGRRSSRGGDPRRCAARPRPGSAARNPSMRSKNSAPSRLGPVFLEQMNRVLGDERRDVRKRRKPLHPPRPDAAADVVGGVHVVEERAVRGIDEGRPILVDPAVVMPLAPPGVSRGAWVTGGTHRAATPQ